MMKRKMFLLLKQTLNLNKIMYPLKVMKIVAEYYRKKTEKYLRNIKKRIKKQQRKSTNHKLAGLFLDLNK
jgi:hypothetical protein